MKKLVPLIILATLMSWLVWSQVASPQPVPLPTAPLVAILQGDASANQNGNYMPVAGYNTVGVTVSLTTGTPSFTVNFEGAAYEGPTVSAPTGIFTPVQCFPANGSALVTTATASGHWRCNVTGMSVFRARVSGYTGPGQVRAVGVAIVGGLVDNSPDSPFHQSLSLGNPLTVPNGGTGAATYPTSQFLQGNGTSPVTSSADPLLISTGSTTARGLATRFAEVSNVKDYGAKGDGVTDDTAAIAAALTASAASNGPGTIVFPPGVYEVTSTLTITNGVRLLGLGAGPGGVLTVGASTVYHGAVIEHNFNGDLFKVTGVNGFVEPSVGTTFENLLLRQIAGNGTGAKGKAINAVAGSDTFKPSWIRIKNVTTETGAGKDDWTWGVYLDGSLTTGFATGLRDVWIENSRFNSGTNGTGEIYCEACANLFIASTEFNGTATNVQLTGADAAHATTGVFITNTTTNGALVLTRATNVFVHGGAWTSVTTTANTATSAILPNYITNTPAIPPAGNIVAAYINALGRYAIFTATTDPIEYRTNGIGLRNGGTAFVGTLDNFELDLITNNTANVTISGAGLLTTGKGLAVTGTPGGFTAGQIVKDPAQGLTLNAVTGSSNDFNVLSAAGASTIIIPTGTSSVRLASTTAGLQVGSPTGGDKGTGTINLATADGYFVNNVALKSITETLSNKTIAAPVLSGTTTGTYTLGGTPTLTAPAITGGVQVDAPTGGNKGNGTINLSATTPLFVNGNALHSTGTPTCGTGCATIVANSMDSWGAMTVTAQTSATVNWSHTLNRAPFCVVSDNSTTLNPDVTSTSTTTMVVGISGSLTGTIYWNCGGAG